MGGVYRLIGAQLRIEVDGMVGMEVLVVFPFFFFFFLDEKNWRHRFVEMRGRSEEGKVVSTLAAWNPFGIYYYRGWIVDSLDNCMQFGPDFLSSARYTRTGRVKADTSVHSFHLSLLLRRGSRFFSKEIFISLI